MDEYVKIQDVRTALLKRKWSPIEWHNIKILLYSIPVAKVHEDIPAEWLNNGCFVSCSTCHTGYDIDNLYEVSLVGKEFPNFCPNCGARMTSQREDGNET